VADVTKQVLTYTDTYTLLGTTDVLILADSRKTPYFRYITRQRDGKRLSHTALEGACGTGMCWRSVRSCLVYGGGTWLTKVEHKAK